VQCDGDLDRRGVVVNLGGRHTMHGCAMHHATLRERSESAVEKSGDKRRMNCAEVAISSTEKFKFSPLYCSGDRDSLPIFHPARESTGERKHAC
jgi:hypothetical protein